MSQPLLFQLRGSSPEWRKLRIDQEDYLCRSASEAADRQRVVVRLSARGEDRKAALTWADGRIDYGLAQQPQRATD